MNPIKKNPLGRGLESLIPRGNTQDSQPVVKTDSRLIDINITDIIPNDRQPRRDFDKAGMEALTESIKARGLMQPVVVTAHDGKYMLIAGERRWRAAGMAGLKVVPAVVTPNLGENDRLELALIENTQREDLLPLELAAAYRSLMTGCGYRQEDVARVAGKSRSAVANTLRLLDLNSAVMHALENKEITEGHARVFLSLSEEECRKLLKEVISRSLSVRQTEALAKLLQKEEANSDKTPQAVPDANLESMIHEMEKFFGAKVKMKSRGKNASQGVIEIKYANTQDLDRIIRAVRGI